MLLEEILESEGIIREEHPELHYQIISQRPQPRDLALIFEELKTIGAKLRDDIEIYISATKNVKNLDRLSRTFKSLKGFGASYPKHRILYITTIFYMDYPERVALVFKNANSG